MTESKESVNPGELLREACVEAGLESEPVAYVPRVAVIGVHGIARHPAGQTQNAMADLLLSLPADQWDGTRLYEPFKAVGIQIPLQRVKGPVLLKKKALASLREQSAEFADLLWDKGEADPAAWTNGEDHGEAREGTQAGNEYTRLLLEGYRGGADNNVYVTTRLEGERKGADSGGAEAKVDIYEVLWADLAHPDSNIVGFFLSLFSLLLHLGSLSRLALDSGSGEMAASGFPKRLWQAFVGAQQWAVRMLQIALPLFKVLLLVVVLSAIPGVSEALLNGKWWFAMALGAIGGTGVGFLIYRRFGWWPDNRPWAWALGAVAPGAVGAGFGALLAHCTSAPIAGSIECWVFLGAPLLGFILSQYESYRKGVQVAGWAGYGLCLGGYIGLLEMAPGHEVQLASLWLTEFVVAAIRLSWLGICLFAISALVLGSVVWRLQPPGSAKRARLRAAVRTSRFALAIPAVLFMLVTAMIWAAMFKVADLVRKPYFCLNGKENGVLGWLGQWLTGLHLIPDLTKPEVCCDYLKSAWLWGLGNQFLITLGLVGLAFFLLLWWALPSALLERFPQRDKKRRRAARPTLSPNDWEAGSRGGWMRSP